MPEIDKKVLYGRLIYAETDIPNFSRLYTPYNSFIINSDDFSKNTVNFYASEVPLFSKKNVKKGNIIGAIFKEDLASISKALKECHVVSDEEDKKLSGETENKTEGVKEQEETQNEETSSPRVFTKAYDYKLKDEDEYIGNLLSFEREYKYPSLYYESNYIEVITAEFNDEEESLTITLKTQDSNLIATSLSDALGIPRTNIKVIPLPYTTHFDEYYISMVKGAIIAAKAAEKYGEVIKLMIRPYSISPSFVVRRKTYLSEDQSRIVKENVLVEVSLGNLLMLEESIADTLVSSLIPSYLPERVKILVKLIESEDECTLFFGSYFKAIAASSTLEHTYALAFANDKEPIRFIEEHLEDELSDEAKGLSVYNQSGVKKHYTALLEADDVYLQSAIYAVNRKKPTTLMSPISAINKAESVAICFMQNALTKQFERQCNFEFYVNRELEGDVRFYLGTPTSVENKERMQDFGKNIQNEEHKVDVGFMPRAYRGRVFTAGPDVLSRHTSVVLNKVKDVYEDDTDTSYSSFYTLYQGTKAGGYGTIIWGIGTLSGYRDYVTSEVVITKAHFVLPHSSSFSTDDDIIFAKRRVMNILKMFNVRFRNEFDYKDSLSIEFVMREPIFDSLECLFPLVLSAYKTLLLELSCDNKKFPLKKEENKTEINKSADANEGGTN